jgi:hypothetical protein
MKKLIKISAFFVLTILFASGAFAQDFQVPDPIPAKEAMDESAPIINSPLELCQYYNSRVERSIFIGAVGNPTENDCLYKISDGMGNIGYIHGYYSGNQYCQKSYGAYFNSAGLSDKTECRDVSRPTQIPKLEPAPGFQPLLEKSQTQLEIEQKNKQLKQELERAQQELSERVQEGYQKDRAAGRIQGEETHYGTVQILREGKITSLDSYIKANAGDIIKTGNDGSIEYGLNDSRTKLGPDTLGVVLGLNNSDKKVITPLDWDKDPSYRPELDHWEFWKNTAVDLIDFIDKNRPNYLKSCAQGNIYGCSWGTVEFIHGGVGWFNEKIEQDFKKNMVVTPAVAMVPVGTEFSVAVDQDGATTVTTFDGEVVVMDLMSRKSAIVGAYQSITIPKSTNGLTEAELLQHITKIDPSSVDRWWERSISEQSAFGLDPTKIIILMAVFGFVMLLIIKRKQIWPNKFTATPALKEGDNKIVTDKYKWLVDNSFATGVFSTMISMYVFFVSRSSQLMLLSKNYWFIFLGITIVGFIFGLLGIRSPRKAFVYIGIAFNIIAIMLWLKIGMII